MPSSRAATLKRMLSAELPAPPSFPAGGLPLCCCLVPPTDETVAVAVGEVEGTGLAVGVAVLSEAVGDGVGGDVGVGDGEGVGDGVGVGVALHFQDTLTLFARAELKVIVALAGQVVLAGIVMVTFFWPWADRVPPRGLMVMFGTPRLVANQVRSLPELVLLSMTEQCVQPDREVGETTSEPPSAFRCTCGAASATGERRASDGIKIARIHMAVKAMNSGNRESLEKALRSDIA